MNPEKRKRLQSRGWKLGSVEEFLDLTPEESAYVELRLKLSRGVRELRRRKGLTQVRLAGLLGSSQSRVAKVEAADSSVALDLAIRSLLALGASHEDLADLIAGPRSAGRRRAD